MKSESLRYEDREIIKFICPSKKKKKKKETLKLNIQKIIFGKW